VALAGGHRDVLPRAVAKSLVCKKPAGTVFDKKQSDHCCGVCGLAGHRIETCPAPGAKVIRALLKTRTGSKVWKRKSFIRLSAQKTGEHKMLARRDYTGPEADVTLDARASQHRTDRALSLTELDSQEEAREALTKHTYLMKPRRCPKCKKGKIDRKVYKKTDKRKHRKNNKHLYWRCTRLGCQAYHNVVRFGCFSHLKLTTSCMQLYRLVSYYTRHNPTEAPRANNAAALHAVYRGTVHKIFKTLRAAEASLAKIDTERCKQPGLGLCGNIEGDAHMLAKCFVSKGNPHFADHVEYWKRRHKGKAVPDVFSCIVKVIGVCRRGGNAIVSVCEPALAVVGAAPPPESLADVERSDLLDCLESPCKLFADGAKAWKSAAAKRRMRFGECSHSGKEFTRPGKKQKDGISSVSGTQSMDSRWRLLGKYVPNELKAKTLPKAGGVNPNFAIYTASWQCRQWRHSQDLFVTLGQGMSELMR